MPPGSFPIVGQSACACTNTGETAASSSETLSDDMASDETRSNFMAKLLGSLKQSGGREPGLQSEQIPFHGAQDHDARKRDLVLSIFRAAIGIFGLNLHGAGELNFSEDRGKERQIVEAFAERHGAGSPGQRLSAAAPLGGAGIALAGTGAGRATTGS